MDAANWSLLRVAVERKDLAKQLALTIICSVDCLLIDQKIFGLIIGYIYTHIYTIFKNNEPNIVSHILTNL